MRTKGRLLQGYCESFCFIDVARGLPVALNTQEMSRKEKVIIIISSFIDEDVVWSNLPAAMQLCQRIGS